MKRLLLAACAVLLSAAQAQAPTLPIRIADISGQTGPCAPPPSDAPAAQKAYLQLLADRMRTEVLNCPMLDVAAAAQALAAGEIDLARLDAAAFAPVSGQVRNILTTRKVGDLNRLPVVVATLASAPAQTLADLAGTTLVFGGPMKASLLVPRQALGDYGADEAFFGAQTVARDYDEAAARLRGGQAQAMVLHAGAWQKLCRSDQSAADTCNDLRVIWHQRPLADQAWAMRSDTTDDRRFRLVGIHVALHNEAPDIFAWLAGPGAEELEPTESKALLHQGPTVGS